MEHLSFISVILRLFNLGSIQLDVCLSLKLAPLKGVEVAAVGLQSVLQNAWDAYVAGSTLQQCCDNKSKG